MNTWYKVKEDKKRKHKGFYVGEKIMVHLRKETFLVGTYNKFKMSKFGLCNILKKHDSRNVYEIRLSVKWIFGVVFNILDLVEYNERGVGDELIESEWGILETNSAT